MRTMITIVVMPAAEVVWRTSTAALTLSVVAINEIVAPALFRLALVRAGETQGTSAKSTEHAVPAPPAEAPAE